MRAAVPRLAFVDALKAIASQLIVLHHLAFYGPMSDVADDLMPALIAWLSQDARIAVQVFLVIGGFLAVRGLAPNGHLTAVSPLPVLRSRYLKLATPYIVALVLSIICAAIAGLLMTHDSLPGTPGVWQFLAHALLVHSVLDVDSLSAGVWYVAIDFQLFALLLGTLWLARRLGGERNSAHTLGALLVSGLAGASLFYFNRLPGWDDWAFYFFGAYAMGVIAYWAAQEKRLSGWLWVMLGIAVAALALDFRSRIAVALLVALALALMCRWGLLEKYPQSRVLTYLGKISYAVFLLNFPVALIVNALFSRFAPDNALVNGIGMLVAWGACIAAGALFYHQVECRASRWRELAYRRVFAPCLSLFGRLVGILRLILR